MRRNSCSDGGHGAACRGVLSHLLVLLLVMLCTSGTLQAKTGIGLQERDGRSVDRLGLSVATSGDVALVGVEWEDAFTGGAYVLKRDGDTWVQQQKLAPAEGEEFSHFGGSVAIGGKYAVVGATWEDVFRGSVYVFKRIGGAWVQHQKLRASDGVPDDQFGSSVAIHGDRILIGTRGARAEGLDSSPVYVFERMGDAWVQQEKLTYEGTEDHAVRSTMPDGILSAIEAIVGKRVAKPMAAPDSLVPPSTVSATDGQFEDRVEVTWSSVGLDAIVYKILRDEVLLSVASSKDSLYIDRTGVPGVPYEYCVVVKDMTGAETTPVCDTGSRIIFPPEWVDASDGQFEDYVEIAWTDRSQIEEGYLIQRDGVLIDTTEANAGLFQDTSAVVGVTYQYEVMAFDAEGYTSQAVADLGYRGFILPPLSVSASDGQYPDRVVITWRDQAVGEAGYIVYRDGASLDTTGADAESYEDTTAVSGVPYEYCVATLRADGTESVRICDEGGIGILPPPQQVSASDTTFDDRVEITWVDASDLEDGYFIFRDGVVYDTTSAHATSYSDFGAEPDSTYTYCVQAFSDSGGVSAGVCDEGQRSIVLAPSVVQATDGDFEDRVEITWESGSRTAVLFKIYRDGTLIVTEPKKSRSYGDPGGTAGVEYTYCVKAVTALEHESASVCDTGHRALRAPSVEASDEAFEDRVLISWTDDSSVESGYHVYRRQVAEADSTLIGTRDANRTSFLDTAAVPGVTYVYSVAAFDTVGEAPGQSPVGVDEGRRVLLAPTDVQATDGAYEDQVEITWEDDSRAEEGYRIYRDAVEVGTTADNARSFVDGTVGFGVHYEYSVAAFDAYGESSAGSDSGFTTILAPVSFNASDTYDDRVELLWIDASEIETGYYVYRNGALMDSTGADTVSYTDNTATQGVEYEYCVQSFSGIAESTPVCDRGGIPTLPDSVPLPARALRLAEADKLVASDGAADDEFGYSVAISGDYAIVGAYYDDDKGTNSGSAYIFARSGLSWSQEAKLIAGDGASQDRFGSSVAISGDVAIVGAYGDDSSKGSAYIFVRSGTAWSQQAKLLAPASQYFGWSVSISGDVAIVGAYGDDTYRGSAYIFYRNQGGTDNWGQQARLVASDRAVQDYFGSAVAIRGGLAIVGAYDDDDKGTSSGSAYIFARSGTGWTQQAKLIAGDGAAQDYFGYSVSISGDVAIVGALLDDDKGTSSGSAYIFARSGTGWTETKLVASDGAYSDYFGYSVSISGDVAIVGARFDDDNGTDSGSAYIFARSGSSWSQQAKLLASDGAVDDYFGTSVAISGGHAIVGSHRDDGRKGSAYGFEILAAPGAVAASDGAFNDRVGVKWKDRSSTENGYRVYRDGQLIETLGPNIQSYNDYEALPGGTYEYSVAAFRDQFRGSPLSESERVSDFGRRPTDGNLTGRISTRVGAAVEGVSVCLDPAPNKALLFDGAGGYVELTDFALPDTFTVEMWVNPNALTGTQALFSKSTESGDNLLTIGCDGSGVSVTIRDRAHSGGPLIAGEWQHLAVVVAQDGTSSEVTVYRDGTMLWTQPLGAVLGDLGGSRPWVLGMRWTGTPSDVLSGRIDEVRLWSRARVGADIRSDLTIPLGGEESGLVGYWPLDEGIGTGVADLTAGVHYGAFGGGVYWTEEGAPLEVCALSDAEGNYVLPNLRYGASTTFRVIPSLGGRQFEPAFKIITLSIEHPVQNEVGFMDISSFTVSGHIKFRDTNCFVPNVEIRVDGTFSGATDKNGKYAVAVGIGEHVIQPMLGDHTFYPSSVELNIEGDVAGVNFLDTEMRVLSGRVGGGCGRSIGTGTIEIRSENECLIREVGTDSTYEVALPPQKYLVRLLDMDPPPEGLDKDDVLEFFGNLGVREANLTEADTTLDFIYRAPLKVVITGFPDPPAGCGKLTLPDGEQVDAVPILDQLDRVQLTIEVYEDYGSGGLCPVDTGKVTIYDEIMDEEDTPVEVPIKNGVALYETAANTPNITAGGKDAQGNNRSYQKALTAVAEVEGQAPVTQIAWVIVTGHNPRTATFVSATSEKIPQLILRDPPGDGSYSFVEKGKTYCTRIYDFHLRSVSGGWETEAKAGLKFEKGVPGLTTETAFQAIAALGLEIGLELTQNGEILTTTTTTERWSTSGDDSFVGGDGDVYLGFALNLIFGKTDVIEIEGCKVVKSEAVTTGGEGFETVYLYTDTHIRDTLIPQLEELAVLRPDSAVVFNSAAENWRNHLALNDSLKKAAPFVKNHSFSAGAEYEYSQTSETSHTLDFGVKVFTNDEAALGFHFEESGVEGDVKLFAKLGFEMGGGRAEGRTETRTVGYTLTDDDAGDFFTVDVKEDWLYATPVFELRSGTSSCPWEAGTQPRDSLALSITPPVQLDVPPDEPAVFTLGLSNLSQSDEAREYLLRSINATNPGGAIFKANGSPIHGGLSFFLEAGQTQEVTLTVERGPNRYNYEDLELMLVPPCEWSGEPPAIADTVRFDVRFQAPCSDIVLSRPLPGWQVNGAHGDSLELILRDFEVKISEEDSIEHIGAEYRLQDTDVWLPVSGAETPKDSLQEGQSVTVQWDLSPIPDGEYELRAFTKCDKGNAYSAIAAGRIDRRAPEVFGTPQPSDGILSYGEDVSLTFDEPIRCGSVQPDRVSLRFVDTGALIAVQTTCDGQTVVLIPQADLASLENRELEARVQGIEDLLGNPMVGSETWIFTVRQVSFAWSQSRITRVVLFGDPGSFAVELVNGGPQEVSFTIAAPSWLTPDVSGGTLPSGGGAQEITFTIQDTLARGTYVDTVEARATGIDPVQLVVDLSVVCPPPVWSVEPVHFTYTMGIVGELLIGGISSTDTSDVVAAFVGREVRGVAPVDSLDVDTYRVSLTVYSNRASGETVRFQVWDDSECVLYDAAEEAFAFQADSLLGSVDAPVALHATMDTDPPEAVSTEPADGILEAGDQIGIRFDEYIRSDGITSDHVFVRDTASDQPIPITWTAGEDLLLIEPDTLNAAIENHLLEATVTGIEDLYGNAIADSISWTFTVDRNPLYWQNSQLSYVKYPEDPRTLAVELHNRGGQKLNYEIRDLPEWLTASPPSGEIVSNSYALIVLTLDAFMNYGVYSDTLYAHGVEGDEPLMLDLRVMAQPPDWVASYADYQYSMSITGGLFIDGQLSTDEFDQIGAFVDGECRGVAYVQEMETLDTYEVFLTIYSNQPSGEELSFRVWDALEGVEYARIDQAYTFEDNRNYGTPTAPDMLRATNEVVQRIDLPAGWYWMSLNVTHTDMFVSHMLGSLSPAEGDIIKSQTAFDVYDTSSASWVGTLGDIDNREMYMIQLSTGDLLETYGVPALVEDNPIAVLAGWNWIGYIPQRNMKIDDALASFGSQADDLIRNQVGYAQYVPGDGWRGSMSHMEPGRGYMLYAHSPGTLAYSLTKMLTEGRSDEGGDDLPGGWAFRYPDYEHNMTIAGKMKPGDGQGIIGAFVEEECRGVAFPQVIPGCEEARFFLMVYSNRSKEETVQFRAYERDRGSIREVVEILPFQSNANVGTLSEPFLWTCEPLGRYDVGYVPEALELSQNYPNPFNARTRIGFGIPEDGYVTLAIYDVLGQRVCTVVSEEKEAGYYFVLWDGLDERGNTLSSGVYLSRMTCGSVVKTRKMVLLR